MMGTILGARNSVVNQIALALMILHVDGRKYILLVEWKTKEISWE